MAEPVNTSTQRALFLDRDGVINEEMDYLWRPENVRFVPGIVPLCKTAEALGYKIVVVTNQSGIGRGLYTEADFHALMGWMREEFAGAGVRLDTVYFCPFHPTHGLGSYRREHPDRKPGPGMLLRASADHGLALEQSILVGDRCTDIAAAHAAGLRRAFLLAGTESESCAVPHIAVTSLAEVERWLQMEG